jgi:hypothetical protein
MDSRVLFVGASGLFTGDNLIVPLDAYIQLPYPPMTSERALVRTHHIPNTLHPPLPVVFDLGSHHLMFVDDNMIVVDRDAILAAINDHILSMYFLYGFPNDNRQGL